MNDPTKTFIESIHQESIELQRRLIDLVKNRFVEVKSDWNGQPFGNSRPSLKGKRFKVESADLDVHNGILLWLEGQRLSIRESEVSWV